MSVHWGQARRAPWGEMERYFRGHSVLVCPFTTGASTYTAECRCKGPRIRTGIQTILQKWQRLLISKHIPTLPSVSMKGSGSLLDGSKAQEASTNNLFMHSEDVRVQPIHESSSYSKQSKFLCKPKPQKAFSEAAA